MKNFNSLNKQEKKLNSLGEYSSLVFDKEVWFDKEVCQIAEVTYSYAIEKDENGVEKEEGPYFNTTFFSSIGGLNENIFFKANQEKREKLLKKAGNNFSNIVNGKIEQIEFAIDEIKTLEYKSKNGTKLKGLQKEINNKEIFENKKELLLKSLIHNKYLLEASIIGLPFELEKAGLKHNLSEEEIDSRCQKLYEIDEICFGGNISKENNHEEIITCYEYIKTTYDKNKDKISDEEKSQYEIYLKEIEKLLPKGYEFKKIIEPEKVTLNKINNLEAHRDNFVDGFNFYFDAHEIEYLAEATSEVANITDTDKSLRFPESKEFETLERIFKLKAHESDGHTINLINGKKIIGDFRGARNIEKEEGIAKLLEHLFLYGKNAYNKDKNGNTIIDLKKIKISDYHPKILLAEKLGGKQLLNFLKLNNKVEKDNMDTLKRFLRLKRNRPLDRAGCQHKDTTYTRGLFEAAKYINDGNNPENLFLGKFGFEDLDKLVKIKNLREQNGEDLNLVRPMFIYEEIYFKLLKRYGGDKYKGVKFMDYLKEKYPQFNLTQLEIKRIQKKTRKKILKIIKMYKANIDFKMAEQLVA